MSCALRFTIEWRVWVLLYWPTSDRNELHSWQDSDIFICFIQYIHQNLDSEVKCVYFACAACTNDWGIRRKKKRTYGMPWKTVNISIRSQQSALDIFGRERQKCIRQNEHFTHAHAYTVNDIKTTKPECIFLPPNFWKRPWNHEQFIYVSCSFTTVHINWTNEKRKKK